MKIFKFLQTLLLIIIINTNLYPQAPETQWSKSFMNATPNSDMEVIETNNGDFLFVGQAEQGSGDVVLVKTDSNGDTLWTKYYGASEKDYGNAIIQAHDGGFLVLGSTNSYGNGITNLWLIKTDSVGEMEWEKIIGESNFNRGQDLCYSGDTSYVLVGSTSAIGMGSSDVWLLKIDLSGNILWQKTYGTTGSDAGISVKPSFDGGFIISANRYAENASGTEAWIIKTNVTGDSLWSRTFKDSDFSFGSPITKGEEDGFFVLYKNYYPGFGDVALIKLDSTGNIIWDKYFYNGGNGYSISQLDNKEIVFCGYSYDIESQGVIYKTDSFGDTIWTKTFNDAASFYSLKQSIDKGYILLGLSNSKFNLVKILSEEINCDFIADTINGQIPLQVQFSDLSSSFTTNWQWDFENNGIFDSYEQNPIHTYFEADTYSVRLIVSNGFISDTLIKEDYISTYFDTFPNLYKIEDIPHDQGGWVKVQFARSAYDTDSLIVAKTSSTEFYTIEIDDGSDWTAVNSTIAYGKSHYSVMVHTTKDSTSESDGLFDFRVIAGMDEGNYVSNVMTGYSVDNLEPGIPQGLMISVLNGNTIKLTWDTSRDADFNFFNVYRTTDGVFDPLTSDPYFQTIDTTFIDKQVEGEQTYYYSISALDFSGNESDFSEIVSEKITSIDYNDLEIPTEFFINQNYPNPFNPTTVIIYGIPRTVQVRLTIYDLLGNEIIALINSKQVAGIYNVTWNGIDKTGKKVSSGFYLYKLEAGNHIQVKKMLLIK